MTRYLRRSLPEAFAVLAGPNPPDELGFRSDRIQILWNCTDEPWSDEGQHSHAYSDEIFIVLKGTLHVEVENEMISVSAGEVCSFPSGVFHAITGGIPPIEALVIRAPAGQDKVYAGEVEGQ